MAKEYVNKAINQKHDKLSMFNLVNALLDEEKLSSNYEELIELLILTVKKLFHDEYYELRKKILFILLMRLKYCKKSKKP